jgi:cell wall-associated NlpC family hydrolase
MPTRLRILLLAFALVAAVFASWAAGPIAPSGAVAGERPTSRTATNAVKRLQADPRRFAPKIRQRKRKPTVGQRAARIALKALGVPYSWGGSSPASGFDCSGLVYWTYGHLGIQLPHSSYALYGLGRRVSRSRLRPGDLLFFSGLGHVGLYIGRGRMIHAPHSGRNVEIVRLRGSHYGSRLVGARRVARG